MAKAEKSARARRYLRITLWSMLFIVFSAMVLPLSSYVFTGIQEAKAQQVQDTNPRANYWRAVRDGVGGYSAVTGTTMDGSNVINTETNMLINNGGQNWRQIRNGIIANYGGWFLFFVIIAILLFFAKFGRVNLEKGRAGQTVERWTLFERVIHWTVAISFIALAITGLSLLFGRSVLIPLMGAGGFAGWAGFAKWLHNWVGPWLFTPGVALMIILWIRHNIPNAEDIQWLAQGGGIVGKTHPHAGRMNGGEKIWFWFICTVGVAAIVSGFFLDFPTWWSASREGMQQANVVHGITALAWIALWFGHAYIGTIGTEGALEGMTTGRVDVNWAQQHHDRWYEDLQKKGVRPTRAGDEDTTVVKEQPA
ncbi:MAG: formate dehydrogenase subunit gamma [Gammaproteobacteria bacterium]|nr:formate dehydrogenase subunit gamma [Gammaproteobacteria bacterium]